MRIGFGYDVHELSEGIKFCLGGIIIPYHKGPVAHSDGDALIHAICDALLGAAGLRDIGYYFPDNSADFRDIDSKILLQKTVDLLKEQGFGIGNIDTTICLQKPKLLEYIPTMQEALARVMDIPVTDITIKATTTEKLGFVGREEGIACYAVVLIKKMD